MISYGQRLMLRRNKMTNENEHEKPDEGLPTLTVEELLEQDIVKLDLGGGDHPAEGYTNVDIQYYPEVDLIADVMQLDEHFPDRSVDAIMCRDTLQCFPYTDTKGILRRWRKVLKPRSRIVIQVYDIEQVMLAYDNEEIDFERFKGIIYGRQRDEYTTFLNCFNEEYLVELLTSTGFAVQEIVHPPMRVKVVAVRE